MLYGALGGQLEVRAAKSGGGRTIAGTFPTGPKSKAVLSDGGRHGGKPKKEFFRQGAFTYSIESADQDIRILIGHDFNRILASKMSETAKIWEDAAGLHFEARLSPEILETTYARDVLSQIAAGLATGISPGFRVAPRVEDAERIYEEPKSEGDAIIRELREVVLYELSIVSAAAYPQSEVEARNWNPTCTDRVNAIGCNSRYRWRL